MKKTNEKTNDKTNTEKTNDKTNSEKTNDKTNSEKTSDSRNQTSGSKDNMLYMDSEVESTCDKLKLLLSVLEGVSSFDEVRESVHVMGLISVICLDLQRVVGDKM